MVPKTKTGFLSIEDLQPRVDVAGFYQLRSAEKYHYHLPGYHFIFVKKGRIQATTAHGLVDAQTGDLVCFRPSDENSYRTLSPTLIYQTNLELAPPPRHKLILWLDETGPLPLQTKTGKRAGDVESLFQAICSGVTLKGSSALLKTRAAILELLSIIAGLTHESLPVKPKPLDSWQEARTQLLLASHSGRTVRDIARQLNITPDHFIRQFRARFGVTPKAFQIHHHLREAARGIRDGRRPIKEVALELGFRDSKAFARLLRKYWGISPSTLRSSPLPPAPETGIPLQPGEFPMNQPLLPPQSGPDWYDKFNIARKRK